MQILFAHVLAVFACAVIPLGAEAANPTVELITTFSGVDDTPYTFAHSINRNGEIAGNFEFTRGGPVVREGFARARVTLPLSSCLTK